jgi:methylphosphotriester-DNA--protein-cysteine methyltransferase
LTARRSGYALIGRDGQPYASARKGEFGGHRKTKIYGRLDCRAALAALLRKNGRGGYARQRVFFASAADAVAAGYRPCGVCLPDAYANWKLRSRRAG